MEANRPTLRNPRPIALALLAALLACQLPALAGWQEGLTPDTPGPVPQVRPFDAEFRIGWSDVEAARAKVSLFPEGDSLRMLGSGSTSGLARLLWQLDASLDATTSKRDFRTVSSIQKESYAKRTITTQIVGKPDGIWRLREVLPPGENPARWKKIKISPLRDLFSAMLFIRSRSLPPGEKVSTIVFPGDAPFLVEMTSLGTDRINVAGSIREAIRLDLKIHRINLKKGDCLETHGKFQSGTVWLSADDDRIPLRAEVKIFIGCVFAELDSINFKTP